MTKPTILFFGFDAEPKSTPKVFLRTLLYSTATRGQVIEGMYVRLRHNDDERVFSFWGYGESGNIAVGSGLHVSRAGLAANHHFVLSVDEDVYHFRPGAYEIDVFADVVGKCKPAKLSTINLLLSKELSLALERQEGVLFKRKIGGEYNGHLRER